MKWRFFILFCLTCMCLIGGSNWISKANAENSEPQASQSHKDHFIFDKEFILNRAKELGISTKDKDMKELGEEVRTVYIQKLAKEMNISSEGKSERELADEVREKLIQRSAEKLNIDYTNKTSHQVLAEIITNHRQQAKEMNLFPFNEEQRHLFKWQKDGSR